MPSSAAKMGRANADENAVVLRGEAAHIADSYINEINSLKKDIADLEARREELRARLRKLMEDAGVDRHGSANLVTYSATYEPDIDLLRKDLPLAVFKRITTAVVDPIRVEVAIRDGLFTSSFYADHLRQVKPMRRQLTTS